MKSRRAKATPIVEPKISVKPNFWHSNHFQRLLLTILIAIFYGNTLTLDYALDDRMVILESRYTIQGGWEGMKNIFTKDTFTGYFDDDGNSVNLIGGGRYRPMSQFSFMVEFQLFGKKIKEQLGDISTYDALHNPANEKYFVNSALPTISHFFNVLYYILLCLLIYEVLRMLFPDKNDSKWYRSLPFIVTLLFALHPIHTEAVANIKGRDEIFAMLGAMAALWCSLKFADKRKWYYLVLSLLTITFGLFSKENAITYLAVVPLALYFYPNKNKKKIDYLLTLIPLLVGSVFFLIIRSQVLGGMMPEDTTHNILNNPYLNSTKAQEIATVLITWGIYLRLLIFPHPLTHDYYPNQIEITDFSNPLVWLIAILCVAIVVFALIKLKKKSILSFAILFFVITFSITSNLLFNIGTFMNERFVFIPSLGFCLIIGYGIYLLSHLQSTKLTWIAPTLFVVVSLLYGGKTFARNFVWENDFTLFTTDVKTSTNSIKCNISAGGSYLQRWKKSHKDSDKANAYKYLQKAIELDNYAFNAHLLMGELLFHDGRLEESYQFYNNAYKIDPNNRMAARNTEIPIRKLLENGHPQEALEKIDEYLIQNPNSASAMSLRGDIYARGFNQLDSAIAIYKHVVTIDPQNSSAWENMGISYAMKKDFSNAIRCLETALKYNNYNRKNVLQNIKMVYVDMGNKEKAMEIQQEIDKIAK